MKLSREEQETIIIFNEAEGTATISTTSDRVRGHLLRAGLTPESEHGPEASFSIPKTAIKCRPKGGPTIRVGGTGG